MKQILQSHFSDLKKGKKKKKKLWIFQQNFETTQIKIDSIEERNIMGVTFIKRYKT